MWFPSKVSQSIVYYGRNSDFDIKAIAQLENPPRRKKELEERLRDFEGDWHLELNTIQPHGLNFRNELKEAFFTK